MRSNLSVWIALLPVASLVAGCSAMDGSSDRRYDDLRSMVLEQRRAIEDLRHEQELVRAAIDQMQYGHRPGHPIGPGGPGGPGSATDDYWQRPTAPMTEDQTGPASNATASAGSPPTTPVPVAPAPPAPSPSSEPEKGQVPSELVGTAYDSAMRQLAEGDQDEAIQSFRNFLHDNATSPYADDAQFWIGEAYFRKGQYHRAIIEFNQVSINYGSGDKAPAALLRQADAFKIVGDRVDAKLSLQKVIGRYPGTGEAAKASKMLSELGTGG
ncbi:MAG TPA: tol-pal system protein YbgF [Candidatus Binatia bacterium]|jgi:tol-pal system protein YbgF